VSLKGKQLQKLHNKKHWECFKISQDVFCFDQSWIMSVQCRALEVLAHACGDHSMLRASPQRALVGSGQEEHTKKCIFNLVKH